MSLSSTLLCHELPVNQCVSGFLYDKFNWLPKWPSELTYVVGVCQTDCWLWLWKIAWCRISTPSMPCILESAFYSHSWSCPTVNLHFKCSPFPFKAGRRRHWWGYHNERSWSGSVIQTVKSATRSVVLLVFSRVNWNHIRKVPYCIFLFISLFCNSLATHPLNELSLTSISPSSNWKE